MKTDEGFEAGKQTKEILWEFSCLRDSVDQLKAHVYELTKAVDGLRQVMEDVKREANFSKT